MPEIYLLFLLLSFLLFVGIKIFSAGFKKNESRNLILTEITVIIPFRNEAENLSPLFESFLKQEVLPARILFIDDHSEDDSVQNIEHFIESNKMGELLQLPRDISGKKAAINYAIQQVKTPYVVTFDADITFGSEYFKTLENCSVSSLNAFPVIMNGKSFLGNLASTEYLFFNAFNFLIARIWPISVSGANLLFDTQAVDYQQQLKSHKHIESGDDYFLLKYFRTNNKSIYISNDSRLKVETNAPHSLATYFNQRVRWLSKSKVQVNWTDTLIGFFISLYFIGGIAALLTAVLQGEWLFLLMIFMLRFLMDALVYLNYAQRLRATKNVLFLPFFQLIYPFLFISVLFLSFFYQPIWKKR